MKVRRQAWIALDLVAVAVFVGIGRSVHDHGLNLMGFASTAWPFVSGLAIGWLALVARHRPARSVAGGVTVCVSTVTIGMSLRVVSGQGTAFAFVLVALGFLGTTMIGWRLTLSGIDRLRAEPRQSREPDVRPH